MGLRVKEGNEQKAVKSLRYGGGGCPKLKSLQDRQKLPMYEAAPERWVLKSKSESEYLVEGDKCLLSVVNCWHTEGESGF